MSPCAPIFTPTYVCPRPKVKFIIDRSNSHKKLPKVFRKVCKLTITIVCKTEEFCCLCTLSVHFGQFFVWIGSINSKFYFRNLMNYTGSSARADSTSAFSTGAHFQKVPELFGSCGFLHWCAHQWRNPHERNQGLIIKVIYIMFLVPRKMRTSQITHQWST